jgi:uncharacterized integral membrane protein
MEVARVLYMLFAILVALGGLAFHVRNNREIVLDYFVAKMTIELSWVMVASVVVGVVLGFLAMTSKLLGMQRDIRRLNRRTQQADRELVGLRAVALKDGG